MKFNIRECLYLLHIFFLVLFLYLSINFITIINQPFQYLEIEEELNKTDLIQENNDLIQENNDLIQENNDLIQDKEIIKNTLFLMIVIKRRLLTKRNGDY